MPKIKLSEHQHPLYEDNIDLFEFYNDSALGGDYIINSDNIFSHRLEDSADHTSRIERGFFLNFCDSIPTLYNSYIFKERVERPPILDLDNFRNNSDGRGTFIGDLVRIAGYFASIFGSMHCLVDIKESKSEIISLRDVRDGKVAPYATLIYPQQLVDWSVDRWGNLRWVIIKSTYYRDDDPNLERKEETHYKLITQDEWRIEDQDGNSVTFPDSDSNGKNGLGIVPLVTMYHKDINNDRIGESLIKDIAYINRTILNWCSCIDEQIERQTFSQLVLPDDGTLAEENETGEDPLLKVGTGSVFTFPHESNNPPQFISPDTNNIKVIWSLVLDLIKEIYRIAGLVGGTGDLYVSRSGRAAQVGFQGVNAALASKASSYQKFENDISMLAYAQLGNKVDTYELVKYPNTFDVSALSDEIDSQIKVMEKNFSPTLNKTMQKNISRRAVPLASQKVRAEIEKEIESGDGVVQSSTIEKVDMTGEDGNPNGGDLDNTNRSKNDITRKDE